MKHTLNPMVFFLGFYLLMKEEKASRKRKNLLYKKLLNREFSPEEFETLYKEFRNAFEMTTRDKFFHTYQWVVWDSCVVFVGCPKGEDGYFRGEKPIQPRIVFEADTMIMKVGRFCDVNVAYVCGDKFFMTQCCYPFYNSFFSIEDVSKGWRYPQLIEATKVAISSLA